MWPSNPSGFALTTCICSRSPILEQILAEGRDPLKDVSSFPFWIRLWEAAIVLAEFIAAQPRRDGATLLELGAGLGAPGLAAAAAGYQVTLSDYEPLILDFERVNAAARANCPRCAAPCSTGLPRRRWSATM